MQKITKLQTTSEAFCIYHTYPSPIGKLLIASDGNSITKIQLAQGGIDEVRNFSVHPLLDQAAEQLENFFDGKRRIFTLPLNPKGTSFQKSVWEALKNIPYGHTMSYKQIAEQIGNSNASRAVGMANHQNPIMIVIPCHRVIGTSGSLTGYAAGLDIKQKLLNIEKNFVDIL